jgi:hypothetical protein
MPDGDARVGRRLHPLKRTAATRTTRTKAESTRSDWPADDFRLQSETGGLRFRVGGRRSGPRAADYGARRHAVQCGRRADGAGASLPEASGV